MDRACRGAFASLISGPCSLSPLPMPVIHRRSAVRPPSAPPSVRSPRSARRRRSALPDPRPRFPHRATLALEAESYL